MNSIITNEIFAEVNALEYADEIQPADEKIMEIDGELILESEVMETEATTEKVIPLENPDTGVEMAIIPAAIALVALIIVIIAKKRK